MDKRGATKRARERSPHLSRRGALLALAVAAAGGVLRPRRVLAWSNEAAAQDVARTYVQGGTCAPNDPRHRELLAAARLELAEMGMTSAEQDAFLAALKCPVCGRSLAG